MSYSNGVKRGQNDLATKWHGRKLVREMSAESAYEYYPIGKHVVIAPGVCGGRPTFKGTRIEVKTILDCLREGRTIHDVLKSYPSLGRAAVNEAMALATQAFADQFSLQAA